MVEFKKYCKTEFERHFNKEASEFKDPDFDLVFSNVNDEEIHKSFIELFSTLSS